MKILYIFPHPDDESFGPAAAIFAQLKEGHEAYLYTLTKGGATKQRHKLGLSIDEMGKVRVKEMFEVEKTLNLTGMKIDDFPDCGLKEMDPRIIERAVENEIRRIDPHIVVSYPVHGISGFHDHLVMHAVIKRVFLELKDDVNLNLKRLAFITLPDSGEASMLNGQFRFKRSEDELIDCIMELDEEQIDALKRSLSCYKTYKATIEESGVIEEIGDKLYFEIFDERFNPPLKKLTDNL